MAISDIGYTVAKPNPVLSDFVESYWMLVNPSDQEQEVVILPDGRVDIFFSYSSVEPFHIVLLGLENGAGRSSISPNSVTFAVSLRLLAVEYLLNSNIADLLNKGCHLPNDFWGITAEDLQDFGGFCEKVSSKLLELLPRKVDDRKRRLFERIYATHGSILIQELSETIGWNSRQINRYFNQRFGLSLKAYCNILRFRASFQHLTEGRLFPEQNFTDQAHFIRDVKKYSGVVPKELSKNENDRFIQFSILSRK